MAAWPTITDNVTVLAKSLFDSIKSYIDELSTLTFSNTGLKVRDTDASHALTIAPGSNLTADRTLTIATGDAARTLTISGNAILNQDTSSSGTPTFAGATTTGNTTLASGSNTSVTIGGGATASTLKLLEPSGSGSNFTAFKAQAQAGDVTYTLPAADGSNGQYLSTNGSGTLSWGTVAAGGGTTDTTTSTGTVNDLSVTAARLLILRCNNASDLTINGITAGTAGDLLIIASVGAGDVYLAHQNTGSTAGNRLVNVITSGNTPLANGVGSAVYVYDGTTARWRMVAHQQGKFIEWSASMAETVSAGSLSSVYKKFQYMVVGRSLQINFIFQATFSATAQYMSCTLPLSMATTTADFRTAAYGNDSTAGETTAYVWFPSSTTMRMARFGANWTAAYNVMKWTGTVLVD